MTEDFLEQLYRNFLKREPDAAGLNYWRFQIDSGASDAARITNDFAISIEVKKYYPSIARLYFAAFNRAPDTDGLDYWVRDLQSGTTLNEVALGFAQSEEFQRLHGQSSDRQFMIDLYRNALLREPDEAGLSFWTSALKAGASRALIMVGFTESAEMMTLRAAEVDYLILHQGIFGELPTQEMIDAALNIDDRMKLIADLYQSKDYDGVDVPGLSRYVEPIPQPAPEPAVVVAEPIPEPVPPATPSSVPAPEATTEPLPVIALVPENVPTPEIDTVSPSLPATPDLSTDSDSGLFNADNITRDNTPTFSGTAESGTTVKLFANGTLVGSTMATDGTWSITSLLLADGLYTVNAMATDAAGNVSGLSGSSTVTIDTFAPTILEVGVSSATTLSVTSSEVGYAGLYSADHLVSDPISLDEPNTRYTITVEALAETTRTKLKVFDLAGNEQIASPEIYLGTEANDENLMVHSRDQSDVNYLFGFQGDDRLLEGALGADILIGGEGSDIFVFRSFVGTSVNDSPYSGYDTVIDLTADDTLWFGLGELSYFDALSDDYVTFAESPNLLIINPEGSALGYNDSSNIRSLTIDVSTYDPEQAKQQLRFSLYGSLTTATDDTLSGGMNADLIFGFLGDDRIQGNAGSDYLAGGEGEDILVYSSAAELAEDRLVAGGEGGDTLWMETGEDAFTLSDIDFTNSDGVLKVEDFEILVLNGTGAQTVILGSNTDRAFATELLLTTQATASSLDLQGAASTVQINATGTDHADTLIGGSAGDVLDGRAGDDFIVGGEGNDLIIGGIGEDVMMSGDGDDVFIFMSALELGEDQSVRGESGDDIIWMETGSDDLYLFDYMFGRAIGGSKTEGFEVLELNGTGSQTVWLGAYTNAAFATGILIGTQETATELNLYGGSSTVPINATGTNNSDVMHGGSADDIIDSRSGNDFIYGGAGADDIDVGDGVDVVFFYDDSDDTIHNFIFGSESGADIVVIDTHRFATLLELGDVGGESLISGSGIVEPFAPVNFSNIISNASESGVTGITFDPNDNLFIVNEDSIAEVKEAIEASSFATPFATDGDGLIILWGDVDANLHLSLATLTLNENGTDIEYVTLSNIAMFVGDYASTPLSTANFYYT